MRHELMYFYAKVPILIGGVIVGVIAWLEMSEHIGKHRSPMILGLYSHVLQKFQMKLTITLITTTKTIVKLGMVGYFVFGVIVQSMVNEQDN